MLLYEAGLTKDRDLQPYCKLKCISYFNNVYKLSIISIRYILKY